jgi:CBS domain-containing protein
MKVAEVMTKEVVTAELTTPYKRVVELLIEHGISAVPVVDEHDRLVGLVSEADLVDKGPTAAVPGASPPCSTTPCSARPQRWCGGRPR